MLTLILLFISITNVIGQMPQIINSTTVGWLNLTQPIILPENSIWTGYPKNFTEYIKYDNFEKIDQNQFNSYSLALDETVNRDDLWSRDKYIKSFNCEYNELCKISITQRIYCDLIVEFKSIPGNLTNESYYDNWSITMDRPYYKIFTYNFIGKSIKILTVLDLQRKRDIFTTSTYISSTTGHLESSSYLVRSELLKINYFTDVPLSVVVID